MNLYGMVGNNPINLLDWLGLQARDTYKTPEEALHECGKKDLADSNTCPKTPGGRKPEKGGRVCQNAAGLYYCTGMLPNAPNTSDAINPKYTTPCDSGDKYIGFHHSHPGGDPMSSYNDKGDKFIADQGKKSIDEDGKVVPSETIPPSGMSGATRTNGHTGQVETQIYQGVRGSMGGGQSWVATGAVGSPGGVSVIPVLK